MVVDGSRNTSGNHVRIATIQDTNDGSGQRRKLYCLALPLQQNHKHSIIH